MFNSTDEVEFASDAATQLDPEPKSVTKPSPNTQEQLWRFRHCLPSFRFWKTIISKTLLDPAKQTRFLHCGENAWVQFCKSTSEFRVVSNRCNLRICPVCSRQRAIRLEKRLQAILDRKELPPAKFLTLTLKPSSRDLQDQIAFLKASFRRLRATNFWKKLTATGIAVIEVTRGTDGSHWHPHLHAVLRCTYVDRRRLSVVWKRITRGSFIVKIKAISKAEGLKSYLTSYLTKLSDSAQLTSLQLADEWIRAVERTHWVISFGARQKKTEQPEKPAKLEWLPLCKLTTLLPLIVNGNWRQAAADFLRHHEAAADERILSNVIDST